MGYKQHIERTDTGCLYSDAATMARVIFSITGTANVLETTIITDFMLANRNEASGIPTYGYLNIYTGNFENFTYELPITRSTNFHPTDVAKDIEVDVPRRI